VVVVASLAVVMFLRPSSVGRFGQTLLLTVLLGFAVMQTPIFKEGFNVLSTRFTEAAEGTNKSIGGGMVERVFEEFSQGVFVLSQAPFFGYGLGIGTNAGAKFLTGRQMFLLSEGEWPRIFLESGQLLGLAYVIWRCAIVVSVGLLCVRAVKAANILPILIFSSGCLPMLNGQFGQPTILGFAVFAMGLALAAQKKDAAGADDGGSDEKRPIARAARPIPRRSEYASRLHGSPAVTGQPNGSSRG
jgi:hypothetical protein